MSERYPGGGCDVENNYGRSMAVLKDGRLAVGSAGEFCGWVDLLDRTGASLGTVRDPDDTSFGRVVGAIGRDLLVGSDISGRVLRIRPDSAAVRAEYVWPEGPDGLPTAIASVGRRVAVLIRPRFGEPQAIHIFHARSGVLRRTIENPDPAHELWPLLVRVGRRLAIVDTGGVVRLLDPKSGAVKLTLQGPLGGGPMAADRRLWSLPGPGRIEIRDHRGRLRRAIEPPDGSDCFGWALAMDDGLLLAGDPCVTLLDWMEGQGFLYSARTGGLLARYEGSGSDEQLGSSAALFPGAVALGGRGPDSADNGIVRVFPR